jgi:hypothetical protein
MLESTVDMGGRKKRDLNKTRGAERGGKDNES